MAEKIAVLKEFALAGPVTEAVDLRSSQPPSEADSSPPLGASDPSENAVSDEPVLMLP
jgi:hypothetical protein